MFLDDEECAGVVEATIRLNKQRPSENLGKDQELWDRLLRVDGNAMVIPAQVIKEFVEQEEELF